MKLLALAASTRPGSFNRMLLAMTVSMAEAAGAEVRVLLYEELDLPHYNDDRRHAGLPQTAQDFVEALRDANGITIASPEYNWSFPGSLKNIIDWASAIKPNPFKGKTALLLSATPSVRGGVSCLIQLRVPLEALDVIIYPRLFALGNAGSVLHDGMLNDDTQRALLSETVRGYVDMTARLA